MDTLLVRTVVRVVAAALVLAGGYIHYALWDEKYRDLPDQIPGVDLVQTGFPVNAAVSVVLAVLVVVVRRRIVVLAALVFEAASLAVLVLTRGPGLFDWVEKDDWGTDAMRTLTVEVAAMVVLVAVLVLERDRRARRSGAGMA